MLSGDMEKLYPSAKTLVKECVASRLHAKDATLYGFSDEAQECAQNYMGWTDLATNPPYPLHEIQAFADSIIAQGLKSVVLIGQGGSTQAPMTITKYHKHGLLPGALPHARFRLARSACAASCRRSTPAPRCSSCPPNRAAPSSRAWRCDAVRACVGRPDLGRGNGAASGGHHRSRLASSSSRLARRAGRAVFSGEPTVGGRFSAMSVFGLLPAALVGINLQEFMQHAVEAERGLQRGRHRQPGHRPGRLPVRQLRAGPQQVQLPHAEARPRARPVDRAAGR